MPSARVRLREDRKLLVLRDPPVRHAVFEALAQPQPLAGAGDVRELGRELAAIDVLQQREDVAQLHARVARAREAARVELAIEIALVEPEEIELEHGRHVALPEPERIEVGDLMAAQAVDLDQARDRGLLLARRRVGGRRPAPAARRRLLSAARASTACATGRGLAEAGRRASLLALRRPRPAGDVRARPLRALPRPSKYLRQTSGTLAGDSR